jgi:AAA domain
MNNHITSQAATVKRLADVQAQRINWLWKGSLPLGKLVILDGDPGTGKSTVCLDIGARVSTDGVMPDGSPAMTGNVLLLCGEDGLEDTIRPRLDAAGADCEKIFTITDIGGRVVSIPRDLDVVRDEIILNGVILMVVDVLAVYLSADLNMNDNKDMRQALHSLSLVAEETGCCIIATRHLNKSGGGNAIYRGGGSIGIIGAARAGFMCAKDPDDESGERRIFANVKMNIGPEPPSLAYTLQGHDEFEVASISWEGTSEHSAADLVRPDDDGAEGEAYRWLREYLTIYGRVPSKEVKKAARDEGIAEHTLQRARKKLNVIVTGRVGETTYWEHGA